MPGGAAGASSASANPYVFRVGGITDPGVHGKQNQDDFFYEDLGAGNLALGVFDGHGRELGQLAARTAKTTVRALLRDPETLVALEHDPKSTMERVFRQAHTEIERVRFGTTNAAVLDDG